MIFKYCPDCGKKLIKKEIGDEGFVPFCSGCQKPHFSFSYSCVLCVVVNENHEIALIKQSYVSPNYVGIAGCLKQGETIEDCAQREVEEEIGLTVTGVKYFKSYYYKLKDLMMFGCICNVKKADFKVSKEVDSAKWFSADEVVDSLTQESIIQTMIKEYLYDQGE